MTFLSSSAIILKTPSKFDLDLSGITLILEFFRQEFRISIIVSSLSLSPVIIVITRVWKPYTIQVFKIIVKIIYLDILV